MTMTTFNSRVKLKTNKQIVKIVALNSELFSKRENRQQIKSEINRQINSREKSISSEKIVKNNNVTYVKIRFRKKIISKQNKH